MLVLKEYYTVIYSCCQSFKNQVIQLKMYEVSKIMDYMDEVIVNFGDFLMILEEGEFFRGPHSKGFCCRRQNMRE